MTGTRLRWVIRTATAVAVFGAAALAPVFTPSASAADPQLTITDAQVTEGNTGTTDLVFTVRSSASGSRKVTVDYATGGGTATATTDYTPKQGTVTIAAGQRSATIRVPVVGDTAQEPDETVEVRLSKPVRAAIADGLGVGTIVNDDAAPPPPVLTVTPTGTGTGGVVSQPSGISCPNDCQESYAAGTTVTLNAYAVATETFTGWTGLLRDRSLHGHDGRRQVGRGDFHRPDAGNEDPAGLDRRMGHRHDRQQPAGHQLLVAVGRLRRPVPPRYHCHAHRDPGRDVDVQRLPRLQRLGESVHGDHGPQPDRVFLLLPGGRRLLSRLATPAGQLLRAPAWPAGRWRSTKPSTAATARLVR